MAIWIDPKQCTACGDCASICPNQAIHRQGPSFMIDSSLCSQCAPLSSPQCQQICPSQCIEYIRQEQRHHNDTYQ